MTEWHLPPDYIVNNWTDELFDLMVQKLVERKQRQASVPEVSDGKVPDTELFRQAGSMIKVVKQ